MGFIKSISCNVVLLKQFISSDHYYSYWNKTYIINIIRYCLPPRNSCKGSANVDFLYPACWSKESLCFFFGQIVSTGGWWSLLKGKLSVESRVRSDCSLYLASFTFQKFVKSYLIRFVSMYKNWQFTNVEKT